MTLRFNPPPGWPHPPAGWSPPPGWSPDPAWPPPPPGWQLWVEDGLAAPAGHVPFGAPPGPQPFGGPPGPQPFGVPPGPPPAPAEVATRVTWAIGGSVAVIVGSVLPFVSSDDLVGGDILPRAKVVSAVFGVLLAGLAVSLRGPSAAIGRSRPLMILAILGVLGYGLFLILGLSGIDLDEQNSFSVTGTVKWKPNVGLIACLAGCAVATFASGGVTRRLKRARRL